MSKTSLRVLFHTNAPFAGTGYATQAALFSERLARDGHDVAVRAFWGLRGARLTLNNVQVLPGSYSEYGEDVLEYDSAQFRPDIHMLLIDVWVYQAKTLEAIQAVSWCPVDHDPIPSAVARNLHAVFAPIAMSQFGAQQMRRIGVTPYYIPHGVDTQVFKPQDRAAARDKWGVNKDTFFAVMVAANKGYPPRKSFDRVMKAWSLFIKDHPDSLLYLHTEPYGHIHGMNLLNARAFYEIPDHTLRFADPNLYRDGGYAPSALADLFSAADVKLLPSAGEGFGIPAVEAQACGCPVIVSDFTAQSELCFGGYKIAIDPVDDRLITDQFSEQAQPRVSRIVEALEWAYEQRGNEALRAQAVDGARAYDADEVYRRYMLPAFHEIVERRAARVTRTEQRLALRKAA